MQDSQTCDQIDCADQVLIAKFIRNEAFEGEGVLKHRHCQKENDSDKDENSKCCLGEGDSILNTSEDILNEVWQASRNATHFHALPKWYQDNEFLRTGYRPPLASFKECFKSIFRLHTETGNIWTHLLGCLLFIGIAYDFMTSSMHPIQLRDKIAISPCFLGAIVCLGLSSVYHIMYCHSERVLKLFCKLDYVGISLLIMGSLVSWIYYGFYCHPQPKFLYTSMIVILGTASIVISMCDKFSQVHFRPLRAAAFVGLGLSGLLPIGHYIVDHGYASAVYEASLNWVWLTACLYVGGTLIYAMRIPERFFPGKCDIWMHSHQLFHLCVIAAALSHFQGITEMAVKRLSTTNCKEDQSILWLAL